MTRYGDSRPADGQRVLVRQYLGDGRFDEPAEAVYDAVRPETKWGVAGPAWVFKMTTVRPWSRDEWEAAS
jgi:hypothetical protein